MIDLIHVESEPGLTEIRNLFREYQRYLGFDLCFQGFERELAQLPGEYAAPDGRLILCEFEGAPAGCIALKPIGTAVCEMKRLFVRSDFRGHGLGRRLSMYVIEEARRIGYEVMKLDTVPALTQALSLYRSLGFREIPAYYANPIPGAIYMQLDL
jgi:GNAT superfamily N-acetyltransferase